MNGNVCDRCGVADAPGRRVVPHRTPVPPEGERITLPLCEACWRARMRYAAEEECNHHPEVEDDCQSENECIVGEGCV